MSEFVSVCRGYLALPYFRASLILSLKMERLEGDGIRQECHNPWDIMGY